MLRHCTASPVTRVCLLALWKGVPAPAGTQERAESGARRATTAAHARAANKCWKNRHTQKATTDGCVQIHRRSSRREGLQHTSRTLWFPGLAQGDQGDRPGIPKGAGQV